MKAMPNPSDRMSSDVRAIIGSQTGLDMVKEIQRIRKTNLAKIIEICRAANIVQSTLHSWLTELEHGSNLAYIGRTYVDRWFRYDNAVRNRLLRHIDSGAEYPVEIEAEQIANPSIAGSAKYRASCAMVQEIAEACKYEIAGHTRISVIVGVTFTTVRNWVTAWEGQGHIPIISQAYLDRWNRPDNDVRGKVLLKRAHAAQSLAA